MRISIFQSKHHNHRIPFLCVSHIFRDSISHISIKMQFHLYLNHIFCFLQKQAICQTARKNALFARNCQLLVNIPFFLTVARRTARVADDHRLLSTQRCLLGFSSDNFPKRQEEIPPPHLLFPTASSP